MIRTRTSQTEEALATPVSRPRLVSAGSDETREVVTVSAYTWRDFDAAVRNSTRVFVWGPPGIGKTTAAHIALQGKNRRRRVWKITLDEDMSRQELVGQWIPGSPAWNFLYGPLVEAFRNGDGLVINELARASGPVKDMMLGVLDDPEIAELVLPDLTRVPYRRGFRAVATSNNPPTDLEEALVDRFDAILYIPVPHPGVIARLNNALPGLGDIVLDSYQDARRAISPRKAIAFLNFLAKRVGVQRAARLAFGERSQELLELFKVLGVEPRRCRHARRE
jgi:MoxR-like ATPase